MVRSPLFRIRDLVRANVNDLLDQLEDPEKLIRQMLRDLETDVDRTAAAVGAAVAHLRRLRQEEAGRRQRASGLQSKAGDVLDAGDEDLARDLLDRRLQLEAAAEAMAPAVAEAEDTVERLRGQLDALRADLEDLRRRQGGLVARAPRAAAPAAVSAAAAPAEEVAELERRLGRRRSEFERLRRRLEGDALGAEAAAEVREGLDDSADPVERRCADLERGKQVEAELAALRAARGEEHLEEASR